MESVLHFAHYYPRWKDKPLETFLYADQVTWL